MIPHSADGGITNTDIRQINDVHTDEPVSKVTRYPFRSSRLQKEGDGTEDGSQTGTSASDVGDTGVEGGLGGGGGGRAAASGGGGARGRGSAGGTSAAGDVGGRSQDSGGAGGDDGGGGQRGRRRAGEERKLERMIMVS